MPNTVRGMSSTQMTTAATSKDWKTLVQKTVEPGGAEIAQGGLDGDELGLVLFHCVDELVDDVVRHLGVSEDHIVPGVDSHRLLDADEEAVRYARCQVAFRQKLLGSRHATFRDLECADPTDGGIDFPHLRRAEGKEEHVGRAGSEIIGAADDVWNKDRNDILFGQPAGGEDGPDKRVYGAHGGVAHADLLTFQVGIRFHVGVLADPESAAQRMQ